MIEELRKNIDAEIDMLREISSYSRRLEVAPNSEKKMLQETINSLVSSMKILNNSVPQIIKDVSVAQRLDNKSRKTTLEVVSFKRKDNPEFRAVIKSQDKGALLRELSISEQLISKIRNKPSSEVEDRGEFKAARGYLKFSNRVFLNTAENWIEKGYFKPVASELKKANIEVLFETYVAMMFFTTLLSIVAAFFIALAITFVNVSFSGQIISLNAGSYFPRVVYSFLAFLAIPIGTFAFLYYYPSTEKDSMSKRIDQELPFAVIHMSAISGSGIEPTEIFKIIATNKEYPYLRREIRKVLNQINLYGYDLVTALNNVSKSTPSTKLMELFSGLGTTIHSGGNLGEFFEKRAESLLLSYRLERERFTDIAETFMDIYISVVIAAPMILMLLLIMLSVSSFSIGLSPQSMTLVIVMIVALVNILFIGFLHMKQPSY